MKTDTRPAWGPFLLLLIFCCTWPLTADWKGDVEKYLKKAHQYDRVAAYLEAHMAEIPEGEKPSAVILLSYAYKETGDTVNEEKWISQYFSKYYSGNPEDIPQLSFPDRKETVKCFQYIENWQRKYPRVIAIVINRRSQKIPYFKPPEKFYIDIQTAAPSGITVTGPENTLLYAGYLHAGHNAVPIPFSQKLTRRTSTNLLLVLKSGSIEITRPITLKTGYSYPQHVAFEPISGAVAIKGEQFKKEHSEETKRTTIKYFDKKRFVKKALPEIGAGILLYSVNQLVTNRKLNSETITPKQKALWNGVDKTSTVFAVGISFKGIIDIIKCFKKEEKITQTRIPRPEAVRYNQGLKQRIREARPLIFCTYAIAEPKGL